MQPYLGFCSSHANTKDVARKTICDHLRKQGQPQEELYIRKKNKIKRPKVSLIKLSRSSVQ